MLNKRFSLAFCAGIAFAALVAFAPLVFAAPAADSQLKIFTRDRATIESDVNGWLSSQQDIIVDQIKANAYGNDYAVTILYRAGGSGRVITRVKIIDSNALSGSGEDGKTLEIRAQEFISSLERTQAVRSVEVLAGSGPWDVFIVYDEKTKNPIQAVTSEEQSPSIVEKVTSFINNLISPPAEQTNTTAPVAEPSQSAESAPAENSQPATEMPAGETPAASDTATSTTTEQSAATTTDTLPPVMETPAETPVETPVAPTEEPSGEQSVLSNLLAASVISAAGSFLFNNRVGGIVFLFLLLAAAFLINKVLKRWEDKKSHEK